MRITKVPLLDRLLILGPPGIGKTEILRQKSEEEARKMNRVFVDLREADEKMINEIIKNPERYYVFYRIVAPHIFPEDLAFPKKVSDSTEYIKFLPPRELAILTLEGIAGVLFIDEITNLQRKDQVSMFFSLIQEKEVAWTLKLSKNIKIILAGNPPESSSVANLLPAPLISRMTVIEVEPPSIAEWSEYMYSRYPDATDIIAKIVAYLNYYKDDFVRMPKDTETLENYPTPRNWTELVLLLHELRDADDELIRSVIIGRLGKETGARLYAYLKKQPPRLELLLENPSVLNDLDVETKIMSIAMVAMNHDKLLKHGDKLMDYLSKTDKDLLVLLLVSMPKEARLKVMMKFKDHVKEIARHIKDYI